MATDNSDLEGKKLIRAWLLKELGGAANCKVLELFGGMGHVHDACYIGVKEHMAFELRKVDRPGWLQGDNRTLLKTRAKGHDLYDLDAYANPWMLANDVMRLRESGRFGLAITCGIYRSLNTGCINGFVRQRIGLNGLANETGLITRWYMDIVKWLMLDWTEAHGIEIIDAKHIASIHSNLVHYFGVIVEKKVAKPAPAIKQPATVKIVKKTK